MSIDGTKKQFEGFLQKRKDTLKIRWVTYWFRLQNATLFFYKKKNGSASHLQGYYYIYTVQSVREVLRADSKRFMFEIIMTNGKRKVLAADTAALRQEWLEHLCQAMYLYTSRVSDSRSTNCDVYEQQERISSSIPICSHSDHVMELLPAQPLPAPAPAPTGHMHHELRSIAPPIFLSEELNSEGAMYQNIPPAPAPTGHMHYELRSIAHPIFLSEELNSEGATYQNIPPPFGNSHQWSSGLSSAVGGQEGDYDILPIRKKICESNASAEMDEVVYDFPLSYRRASQPPDHTENIYDVPSSLLKKLSDHTLEEQPQDGLYWRI